MRKDWNSNWSEIRVPKLPDLEATSDGRFRRVWHFNLEYPPAQELTLTSLASQIEEETIHLLNELISCKHPDSKVKLTRGDYLLTLEWASSSDICGTTYTGQYSRTDELWLLAPVWLIMRIATHVGQVTAIDGVPKAEHDLWKRRRMFWGDLCPI